MDNLCHDQLWKFGKHRNSTWQSWLIYLHNISTLTMPEVHPCNLHKLAARIRNRWKVRLNLENLIYNYLTICKWVVYEFCFWNKKQIRNKNGFLGKSSFFCLHYFSFLSLACNQSTNPSYYNAFSSWFNICFFIYPGIRSEKRKVLFSMIDINMCKVKNNHPSNQIFVYF